MSYQDLAAESRSVTVEVVRWRSVRAGRRAAVAVAVGARSDVVVLVEEREQVAIAAAAVGV